MKKNKILLFRYDRKEISQSEVEQIAKTLELGFKQQLPNTIVLFLPDGMDILSVTHLEREDCD